MKYTYPILDLICLLGHSFIHFNSASNLIQKKPHTFMWSKTKTNRQKLNKPSKYGLLFYLGECTFSVLSIVPYCLQISLVFITLSVPCPPFSFPPLSKSRPAAPSSVALLPRGIRGAVPSQQQSIYRAPFFCCRQLLRGSFSCFRRRSSPLLTRLLLLSYMMGAAQ